MSHKVDLDALEKLHAAAKLGPMKSYQITSPGYEASANLCTLLEGHRSEYPVAMMQKEWSELCAAAVNALPSLIAELRSLRELVGTTSAALADVHKMIEDGELVRDISKDHAPDWAIKAFDFVTRLQKIEIALAAAKKWEDENV